jgi:hypothetical protein
MVRTPRSGGGHGHGSAYLAGVADGPCGHGGLVGIDWVRPSGSIQVGKDRFCFFSEIIFQCKTNLGKPRKCLKAQKIPKKSQKFQENSQRYIET